MASLKINNVKKRFGSTEVLKGIDISIEQGDFLVLVGPSGCGKSTLLNMIAGLDTVSEGDIVIGDQRVNDLHPSKRDIAMVFQSYALYPNMNVEGNIAFGLEMRGVPRAERRKSIDEVARLLQIDHLLKRKPGQLSGGQRQRVAMGRALVRQPRIFLFDEPLSNLDAKLRVDMRTEIKRLHQRLQATIVYVTHDQIEAMTLASRIAVMKQGELQQLGTPQEVYDQPANTFVAGFMGSPSMNLFPVTLRESDGSLVAEVALNGAGPLRLTLAESSAALGGYRDREVILGIRPEAITDPAGADREGGAIQTADCLVEVTEPTGADTYVVTTLGGTEVIARMRANAGSHPGKHAPFAFNMRKAVLFDRETGERVA